MEGAETINLEKITEEKNIDLIRTNLEDLSDPITRRKFLSELSLFAMISGGSTLAGYMGLATYSEASARNREVSTKETKYEVLPDVSLPNATIQLVGVKHIPETYFANRVDIDNKVKDAPFVVMEYFSEDIAKYAHRQVSDEVILQAGKTPDYTAAFFGAIGRAAAINGKDIFVVNPETPLNQLIEAYTTMGLAGNFAFHELPNLIEDLYKKRISRRDLLKIPLLTPAAVGIASWFQLTRKFRSTLENLGIMSSDLNEQEKADILGWSLIDYRDLNTAKGIQKMTDLYSEKIGNKKVPVFQGARHNSVFEYLLKPKLIDYKDANYLHHNIVGDHTIRKYTFDDSSDNWKEEVVCKYA